MSLKAELQAWRDALKAYDAEEFDLALSLFKPIAEYVQHILKNPLQPRADQRYPWGASSSLGLFDEATRLDPYFAVAYHQAGVSCFLVARYDDALSKFEEALLYMRGNQTINYEQLGLAFRLFSAEIYFNIGLSKIYLGQIASGMLDLQEAQRGKQIPEHEVIDDAIRDQGRDYTVFSIPVGILFKPPASKLNNLKTKDYRGKARLIAASDPSDAFTTFTGITRLQRGQMPSGAPLDAGHIKRSASVSAIEPFVAPLRAGMSRSNTITVPAATEAAAPAPSSVAPLRIHSRSGSHNASSAFPALLTRVSLPFHPSRAKARPQLPLAVAAAHDTSRDRQASDFTGDRAVRRLLFS